MSLPSLHPMKVANLRGSLLAFAIILFGGIAGASAQTKGVSPQSPTLEAANASSRAVERIEAIHLPNAIRVHTEVISGGLPEGDEAFGELKSLGVKTIISVDGAVPEVERAQRFGMRYVHLPHGYDGISEDRKQELALAVASLPRPIYIHCHHGKHRSPAAAAVACITSGLIPKSHGIELLQLAGTNPNYRGLFEAVEQANLSPLRKEDLKNLPFRSVAQVTPLAETMVEIDRHFESLKMADRDRWPKEDRESSANQALLLLELYKELMRHRPTEMNREFDRYLAEGITIAERLEKDLRTNLSPKSLQEEFRSLGENCIRCHREVRDVPLSQKGKQGSSPK